MAWDVNVHQKQEGLLSQMRCPENYKLIRKRGGGRKIKKKEEKEASLYEFQDFIPLKLN